MEQLTYNELKAKLKLSYQELQALNNLLGRLCFSAGIKERAMLEYAIKKRMEFARKLMSRKKDYSFTLGAIDCMLLLEINRKVIAQNEYENVLQYKIIDTIYKQL